MDNVNGIQVVCARVEVRDGENALDWVWFWACLGIFHCSIALFLPGLQEKPAFQLACTKVPMLCHQRQFSVGQLRLLLQNGLENSR